MECGFYKFEDNLLFAPNFVATPEFVLLKEEKDTIQFPVDGWYWFESEEEANQFFNIPKPTIE
jgi:hypothetical protein